MVVSCRTLYNLHRSNRPEALTVWRPATAGISQNAGCRAEQAQVTAS